jgi:hypothetical protein
LKNLFAPHSVKLFLAADSLMSLHRQQQQLQQQQNNNFSSSSKRALLTAAPGDSSQAFSGWSV